jgi:beta-phosphoglucomutase
MPLTRVDAATVDAAKSSAKHRDMKNLDITNARTTRSGPLTASIFDVDGVLLASPHEQAWREALSDLADPARFTTAMYQAQVAGKPRLRGARAALEALGVPNATQLAVRYAQVKQERLEELIKCGKVAAFPDALRFVQALVHLDFPCAAASSSKNANQMMRSIHLASGMTLLDAFKVNVCGRDLPHGKPSPDIFLLAARELGIAPMNCLVVEDAPAGIEAARAGSMTALGIARLHDTAGLLASGADLVVTSLDQIAANDLSGGRLCRCAT